MIFLKDKFKNTIKQWLDGDKMERGDVEKRLSKEPYTAAELARIFGKHHYTIERYMERLKTEDPRVRAKKVGRATIYWIQEDEPLEEYVVFAREMLGAPSESDELLMGLLRANATSFEKATPQKMLGFKNKKVLDKLIRTGRIVLTSTGKVYLTEFGKRIAEGAAVIWE